MARICPLGIIAIDLDGRVLVWNAAATNLFGWSEAESLGELRRTIKGVEILGYLDHVQESCAISGVRTHQAAREHKDGVIVHVLITTTPIVDENGTVIGLSGVHQDITERVRSEAAFHAKLARLEAVMDGIPSPVFYKDTTGNYLGCNSAFERLVAHPRSEIVGKSVFEVHPPDIAAEYAATDRRLSEEGALQLYETRVRCDDGATHDVIFHKGLFFDDDGTPGGHVGTMIDISAQKRVERELRESDLRYRTVVSALQEGVILKDTSGNTLACNAAAEEILDYRGRGLTGHSGLTAPFILFDENEEPVPSEKMPTFATLRTGRAISDFVLGFDRVDGSRTWISLNTRPLFTDGESRPHAVVLSFSDITARRTAQETLSRQAYIDVVTGLPNRLQFERIAQDHVQELRPFALLYMDLDGFKRVNDTLGHAIGDELLKIVGTRFSAAVRHHDTVARFGGDEFTILLSDVRSRDEVPRVAERILAMVQEPIDLGGQEIVIGVSIGGAMYPEDGTSLESLAQSADDAMYRAKEAGKNRIVFHAPRKFAIHGRLTLENELRRSIERDQLELHYQPKVQGISGRVLGAEALVRWRHPTRGLLAPEAFLPIAEQGGLIEPLTEWVLRRACEQMASWRDSGRWPLRTAVNVSARQVGDPALVTLVTLVERTLKEAGVPPSLLELEITEDAIMRNTNASSLVLGRLRELGVTIAIDDFGTGYSSLSYLQRLPIDTLKIDRSFVSGMSEPGKLSTRPIVEVIVSMARALDLGIVAEGVETAEQAKLLVHIGCDQFQGFHFARPMPADDFAARYLPCASSARPCVASQLVSRLA